MIIIGIAGLDNLSEVLRSSHESSLRMFNETRLKRLTQGEVKRIVNRCLNKANEINEEQTSIDEEGMETLLQFSEGYPHFIQQLGYCAFEQDTDNHISGLDVAQGAVGERGAIEQIESKYYRDDFYNRIQKDSYRQVLRIMADSLDSWVQKKKFALNSMVRILL